MYVLCAIPEICGRPIAAPYSFKVANMNVSFFKRQHKIFRPQIFHHSHPKCITIIFLIIKLSDEKINIISKNHVVELLLYQENSKYFVYFVSSNAIRYKYSINVIMFLLNHLKRNSEFKICSTKICFRSTFTWNAAPDLNVTNKVLYKVCSRPSAISSS